MDESYPLTLDDWYDLLRKRKELFVQGVGVDASGRVYEVVTRAPGSIECFYLDGLVEATFQHRGCGCGPDVRAEGDYLLVVQGVNPTILKGKAQPFDLEHNLASGEPHILFLHFTGIPSHKIRTTLRR